MCWLCRGWKGGLKGGWMLMERDGSQGCEQIADGEQGCNLLQQNFSPAT